MANNELSIFDLGVEDDYKKEEPVVSPVKPSAPTPKPTSKPTSKPKVSVPKPEEIKVNEEWTIHFATERFLVTDFLEEIPEDGVSLEEIRVEMCKTFFQFTASRTKWDIDKDNKRLFPDAYGAAKGARAI